MVRFIFICMGVVALSFLGLAGQFIFSEIARKQEDLTARNEPASQEDSNDLAEIPSPETAEDLNSINTAAGQDSSPSNETIKGGFRGTAPKALEDDQQAPITDITLIERPNPL